MPVYRPAENYSSPSQKERLRETSFAASVLRQEAHALALLARGLDAAFCEVVDCLYGVKGRIAVTGMGKSGHVARKVAATLASTVISACLPSVMRFWPFPIPEIRRNSRISCCTPREETFL